VDVVSCPAGETLHYTYKILMTKIRGSEEAVEQFNEWLPLHVPCHPDNQNRGVIPKQYGPFGEPLFLIHKAKLQEGCPELLNEWGVLQETYRTFLVHQPIAEDTVEDELVILYCRRPLEASKNCFMFLHADRNPAPSTQDKDGTQILAQ
jgi:hypothetical protein